jgi:hypothetical protein
MQEPNLEYARRDKLEESSIVSAMEIELPKSARANKLKPEPKRCTTRRLSAEPRVKESKTEAVEPKRLNDRMLTVEESVA